MAAEMRLGNRQKTRGFGVQGVPGARRMGAEELREGFGPTGGVVLKRQPEVVPRPTFEVFAR